MDPKNQAAEPAGPVCKHCGGPIAIRNPTGKCDHLYWPENLTDEARQANGLDNKRGHEFRKALASVDYWLGITEHNCDAPYPIGSCLACDLEQIKGFLLQEVHNT